MEFVGFTIRASSQLGRTIGGIPCPYQGLIRIYLLWIVGVSFLALCNRSLPIISFTFLNISLPRCKKNAVAPTPTYKLAELLEDK